MKELSEQLKKELVQIIKKDHIYSTISSECNVNNLKQDWLDLFKRAKWKSNYGNSKNIRLIKNLELLQPSIYAKCETSLLGVHGIVYSNRDEEITEIFDHYKYENMSEQKSDFDYKINEGNLERVFDYDSSDQICLSDVVFSVSTVTDKKIPDCPECDGKGLILCPECNGTGRKSCESCNGRGWILCENCDGLGEIRYIAGNYANGEERKKTKTCPICDGKGKLKCKDCDGSGMNTCEECDGNGKITCSRCHGTGKMVNGPVMQTVKYFKDKYFFEKGLHLYVFTDDNSDSKRFEFKKKAIEKNKREATCIVSQLNFEVADTWLYSLQISQLYQAPGKIIVDNREHFDNEMLDIGSDGKFLYNSIKNEIFPQGDDIVCVLENYYATSPITVISVKYTDLMGSESNLEFYVWENLLWCDCYVELSFGKLLLLKIKKALS